MTDQQSGLHRRAPETGTWLFHEPNSEPAARKVLYEQRRTMPRLIPLYGITSLDPPMFNAIPPIPEGSPDWIVQVRLIAEPMSTDGRVAMPGGFDDSHGARRLSPRALPLQRISAGNGPRSILLTDWSSVAVVTPFRNLLVHGLNHALGVGRLSLEPGDVVSGHMFASIAGRRSVVLWADAGAGEVRVSVWWDYDDAGHPKASSSIGRREQFLATEPSASRASYPRFVGATASGWLERIESRHLQGRGNRGIFDRYLRHSNLAALAALPVAVPDGYAAEGILYVKQPIDRRSGRN